MKHCYEALLSQFYHNRWEMEQTMTMPMTMPRTMRYPVILEDGGEGWIVARCPTLRGCIAQGETRAEALANFREVLELTLQVRHEVGLPVSDSELEFLEIAEVSVEIAFDEAALPHDLPHVQ
jgi:predicted RNase H-like HicB family nuclease